MSQSNWRNSSERCAWFLVDVTRELWIRTTTQQGRKSHAFQSRRSLSRARQSRSSEHRLSSVENAAGKEDRPRCNHQADHDQHLRQRPAYGPRAHDSPAGLVLGHEITGEVIECGSGVEFISKGTWSQCRSTSRPDVAVTARSDAPTSAST